MTIFDIECPPTTPIVFKNTPITSRSGCEREALCIVCIVIAVISLGLCIFFGVYVHTKSKKGGKPQELKLEGILLIFFVATLVLCVLTLIFAICSAIEAGKCDLCLAAAIIGFIVWVITIGVAAFIYIKTRPKVFCGDMVASAKPVLVRSPKLSNIKHAGSRVGRSNSDIHANGGASGSKPTKPDNESARTDGGTSAVSTSKHVELEVEEGKKKEKKKKHKSKRGVKGDLSSRSEETVALKNPPVSHQDSSKPAHNEVDDKNDKTENKSGSSILQTMPPRKLPPLSTDGIPLGSPTFVKETKIESPEGSRLQNMPPRPLPRFDDTQLPGTTHASATTPKLEPLYALDS